jgi:hypothetical protein
MDVHAVNKTINKLAIGKRTLFMKIPPLFNGQFRRTSQQRIDNNVFNRFSSTIS